MAVTWWRRRVSGRHWRGVALAMVAACGWLALPGVARAVGELSYDGCVANDATHGCTDLPFSPLQGARGIAVSPDGGSVYVASSSADSVTHFVRGGQGRLSFDACLASTGANGCVDLPFAQLSGAYALAVSPTDGVYVTSFFARSVSHFFRDGPGHLAFGGCVADAGTTDQCTLLTASPLVIPLGVAVSPNGASVYVTGSQSNSVSHFFAAPEGQVTFGGCVGVSPCTSLPAPNPLAGAQSVAVSPDGGSVYVASLNAGTLTRFTAAPQGQITFAECFSSGPGTPSCVDLPGTPLEAASGLAVSPDGRSVYVASAASASVAHFVVRAGGQLAYAGCWANDSSGGCDELPGMPLGQARGVAVSPEGKSVYVASEVSNSVSHFFRDGQGRLSYDGCLGNDFTQGCAALIGAPLGGATAVAVSPDGKSVYVASLSGSVAHFLRAGAAAPGAPGGPGQAGGAPTCFGRRATIMGSAGRDVIRGTSGADVIVAGAGGDTVIGGRGNDLICAGDGADRVIGGRGNDRVSGGSGPDVLSGGLGADRLAGDGGNDRLLGGDGRDVLVGGAGADRLSGEGGADVLAGGGGRDVCIGGRAVDSARACEATGSL